ncbi:MAG TPA: helix-turn-helix domain-containing protein [Acidimicrobiales bacterium]|nr:helix-turn-helix domain-containing protein [Acidimicrobiales bacterium]
MPPAWGSSRVGPCGEPCWTRSRPQRPARWSWDIRDRERASPRRVLPSTVGGVQSEGRRGVIPLTGRQHAGTGFLTVSEVAASLRVSTMTVYRLINAGQLPAVRVGRSYRLREEDVDKYLADRYTEAG